MGSSCTVTSAFPFQPLTSGSSAGSGPCLSLPVPFVPLWPIPASAAAGAAALQVRGLGVPRCAARGVAVGPGGSCFAVLGASTAAGRGGLGAACARPRTPPSRSAAQASGPGPRVAEAAVLPSGPLAYRVFARPGGLCVPKLHSPFGV